MMRSASEARASPRSASTYSETGAPTGDRARGPVVQGAVHTDGRAYRSGARPGRIRGWRRCRRWRASAQRYPCGVSRTRTGDPVAQGPNVIGEDLSAGSRATNQPIGSRRAPAENGDGGCEAGPTLALLAWEAAARSVARTRIKPAPRAGARGLTAPARNSCRRLPFSRPSLQCLGHAASGGPLFPSIRAARGAFFPHIPKPTPRGPPSSAGLRRRRWPRA